MAVGSSIALFRRTGTLPLSLLVTTFPFLM